MPTPFRILMICTGNICRSIMAEIIVREEAAARGLDPSTIEIRSAGVSTEETGNGIDYRAQAELARAGYPTPAHRAHQATRAELSQADLILAMTAGHVWGLERLCQRFGLHDRPILLFRTFDDVCNPQRIISPEIADQILDVEDPWYGGPEDFVTTRETLERCAPVIVDYVEQQLSK